MANALTGPVVPASGCSSWYVTSARCSGKTSLAFIGEPLCRDLVVSLRERVELFLRQQAVRLLRPVEDARDTLGRRRVSVRLEPEDDVRLTGHRSDFDALLA